MGVGKDELCEASGRYGKHREVAWGKALKITDFSSLKSFCNHFFPLIFRIKGSKSGACLALFQQLFLKEFEKGLILDCVWVCVPLQTVQDGRQFMKYIDPHLGVPLPERDYGGNCLIYDPGNGTDPFHNIWVRSKLAQEAGFG